MSNIVKEVYKSAVVEQTVNNSWVVMAIDSECQDVDTRVIVAEFSFAGATGLEAAKRLADLVAKEIND